MTIRKSIRTKGRTTIYKTLHRKLKIEQHEPHWKPRVKSVCSMRVCSSCSTSSTRRTQQEANAHPLWKRERQTYVFASQTYFAKNLEKAEFVAWMPKRFGSIACLNPNYFFVNFEKCVPPHFPGPPWSLYPLSDLLPHPTFQSSPRACLHLPVHF